MTHRILIIIVALMLVGCGGRSRTNNEVVNTPKDVVPLQTTVADTVAVEIPKTDTLEESVEEEVVDSKLLAKIDVTKFRKYGLLEVESVYPFSVKANELINLKNPELANGSLNQIRFEEWNDEQWLDNNYIRAVRLYIDAYNLGILKNPEIDKYKPFLKGKFAVFNIEGHIGGGLYMYIVLVDNPKILLAFWVYSAIEYDPLRISAYDVRFLEAIEEDDGLTTDEVLDLVQKNPQHKLW